MQVKKFEAPTLQEALDTVKRELGPEAIILQTRHNRKGFGLLSKGSVEITAAVSNRAIVSKQYVDARLPSESREAVTRLPADRQVGIYDKYGTTALEKLASKTKEKVEIKKPVTAQRAPVTTRRYADIQDDVVMAEAQPVPAAVAPTPVPVQAAPPAPFVPPQPVVDQSVQLEIEQLKRMVNDLAQTSATNSSAPAETQFTPAIQDAIDQLLINGVDRRNAYTLAKQVRFALGTPHSENPDTVLDQLALEIMENTKVLPVLSTLRKRTEAIPLDEPSTVIAFVGPTGVGKTTTVAKIASDAVLKRQLKTALINLDTYKIAASEGLATYAKILNIPFRLVSDISELQLALGDFKGFDLILIDTSGRSHKDTEAIHSMSEILRTLPNVHVELVVSSVTRDAELLDIGSRFSVARPEAMIFTKLDEASSFGAIYNAQQKLKLPFSYFTTGQKVPEDIEEATTERVAALVMDL